MKVYVVTEWNNYDHSTEVVCVQGNKEKAEIKIKELKEEASHWSKFSFEEFEVG